MTTETLLARREASTLKRKVSPVVVTLIVLVVVGIVGAIMYNSSEPPIVGTNRTFESERQRMESTRQGIME